MARLKTSPTALLFLSAYFQKRSAPAWQRSNVVFNGAPVRSLAQAPLNDSPPQDEATFAAWLSAELSMAPNFLEYREVFEDVVECVLQWRRRYRGNPKLWKSLMRGEKVVKEIIETAPVIAAVRSIVAQTPLAPGERFTIIDLCSGKGYLSMLLSELLPASRVERCFLVDKQWPAQNWEGPIASHHISDAHIYSEREQPGASNYFTTWPVPLHTSKQNLKKGPSTMRAIQKHILSRCSGPVLVLAVHLCGTLALRAVDIFNNNPDQVKFLALKPCCLPGMVHAKRDQVFTIGSHSFNATDVCSNGKFLGRCKGWSGPPRQNLKNRFERWTSHLCKGIALSLGDEKCIHHSLVQTKGGYQNLYIFAERSPSASLWEHMREAGRATEAAAARQL